VCLLFVGPNKNLNHVILDTLLFTGVKNNSWHTRKGDLQCAFPLNILIVHSSMLIVATDGERMTCGGFSLSETIYFGSLEFIADCFDSFSLSQGEQLRRYIRGNNL
jgi:hypothetical protein